MTINKVGQLNGPLHDQIRCTWIGRPQTTSLVSNVENVIEKFPLGQSTQICVKTPLSLLKEKKIDVLYNLKTGLSACVTLLDAEGQLIEQIEFLPLTGLSKEIAKEKDIDNIKRFFDGSHLIAEKGVDGTYNRVSVHVSGQGGVNAKIPFQPGLALGSVVKGEILQKMDQYAKVLAARESIEKQINAAEQRIDMLALKIESKENENKNLPKAKGKQDVNNALILCWKNEIGSLENLVRTLTRKLESDREEEIPVFENFNLGLETPIDMGRSTVEVQPRGFDNLNFNSQYINMSQSFDEIHDKAKHASEANTLSAGGGFWMFGASASHTWSNAASERLAQIKKEDKAEGVFMINAITTTRHVRSFTDVRFDKKKLGALLEIMKVGKDLDRHGITTVDGEKMIYLLTEAVLGGSFTALVTFLDETKTDGRSEKHTHEHGSDSSAKVKFRGFGANASAGFARSQVTGTQSEDDVLKSLATTKVNIEIIAQGAIPTFTRNMIEHEIIKHLDLNPSKFELSKKDEAEAATFVTSRGAEQAAAIYKRRMKMENAQVAVLNTYRGMISAKEKQTIHTPESVMEAYDSFSAQMTTDSDCGVPIGFNYQVFTERMLQELFEEIEDLERLDSIRPNRSSSLGEAEQPELVKRKASTNPSDKLNKSK